METLILLAMADHADHEGGHVFPSQALISWKTRIFHSTNSSSTEDSLKDRKSLFLKVQATEEYNTIAWILVTAHSSYHFS